MWSGLEIIYREKEASEVALSPEENEARLMCEVNIYLIYFCVFALWPLVFCQIISLKLFLCTFLVSPTGSLCDIHTVQSVYSCNIS